MALLGQLAGTSLSIHSKSSLCPLGSSTTLVLKLTASFDDFGVIIFVRENM